MLQVLKSHRTHSVVSVTHIPHDREFSPRVKVAKNTFSRSFLEKDCLKGAGNTFFNTFPIQSINHSGLYGSGHPKSPLCSISEVLAIVALSSKFRGGCLEL